MPLSACRRHPAEGQRKLLASIEQYEAEEMGAGAHEKFLKIADELEKVA